jgi:hypothetical protein
VNKVAEVRSWRAHLASGLGCVELYLYSTIVHCREVGSQLHAPVALPPQWCPLNRGWNEKFDWLGF